MDLSKFTDAELEALAGGGGSPAPSPFAGMSDADLEKLAGPAPAPDSAAFQPIFGSGDADSFRQDQVLGRGVLKGLGTGFLGLPALAADAGRNVAFGAKKLAAKAGLVEAPDPANYYGAGGGYLPTATTLSEGQDKALDAAGFAKPQTAGERLVMAGAEGAAGGVGGFLSGRAAQAVGAPGGFMAATPAPVQAASGAIAGVAGQGTAEAAETPLGKALLPEWAPAAVGLATGVASGGFLGRAASRAGTPAAPSRADLVDNRDAAYARARGSGVEVQPQAFGRLTDSIRQDLDDAGIFRDLDPGPLARRLLEPFDNSAGGPVPLDRLEAIRKNVGAASRSADPTEQRVAGIIRSRMDDFIERQAGPADLIEPSAGAGARAVGDLREGRRLHARVRKDTALENALMSAEDRAGSTGSGANLQNAERQDIRKMIRPDSATARKVGFNAEETAQARGIVRGGTGENVLRAVGKLAPTGAVSFIPTLAATTALGPQGLALPLAGYLAKGAAERIQRSKVERLGETIRRGSAAPVASGAPGAQAGAVGGFLAGDPGGKRQGRYR